VQCSSNEDHVTLNYADSEQEASALTLWVILADGSTLDKDVNTALRGSGTWLSLPSSGSDNEPIRLLIRRSLSTSEWQFRLQSVSLGVLNARRVVIQVFDFDGEVTAHRAVS